MILESEDGWTPYRSILLPLGRVTQSGKGRGELASLLLSIRIWLAQKRPAPDTHQETALKRTFGTLVMILSF